MLATQVNYWNYVEAVRHNRATESLTDFINRETVRHNLEYERQGRAQIDENVRHNKVSENIAVANLTEVIRHNRESEAIGYSQARASLMQADAARTSARANLISARAQRDQASIAGYNAIINASRVKAQNKYTAAQTKGQQISNKFAPARETVQVIQSVTSSFKDMTGGIKDLGSFAKDIVSITKGGLMK